MLYIVRKSSKDVRVIYMIYKVRTGSKDMNVIYSAIHT